MRTRTEIDNVMNDAADQIDKGRSKFPGMSYEEGVDAALRWAVGDQAESPMDD